MGMDVSGRNPRSEVGEYFRNNVWWWHPLWSYCQQVAPELCSAVAGHSNDGDGLCEQGAGALAGRLQSELDSGRCSDYERDYNAAIAELDLEPCRWCDGSGIRTDEVGLRMGMDRQVLDDHVAVVVGRDTGWCNGCGGEGTVQPFEANYEFSCENVAAFAAFAAASGGFAIW
jgi:hypothetical protein